MLLKSRASSYHHLGCGRSGLSSLGAVSGSGLGGLDLLIGLVRAVDGDLDSNLAAVNVLSVHLSNSLLLQLLRSQRDEAEATALAGLATSLELLDHKAWNRAKSDLGRQRLVGSEKLLKLSKGSAIPVNDIKSAKCHEPSPRSGRTGG